ncbi:MAG TPA: hypothetical protein VFN25_03980, partial [Dokdonella sp.]|nr:hypothetical protein [Dokdonella sp.]
VQPQRWLPNGPTVTGQGLPMKIRYFGWLMVAAAAGCTTVEASQAASASLCEEARGWSSAASEDATRILPSETSEEGGRTYRFDLAGRGGLRVLHAECGWASYSECAFQVTRIDGSQYAFSDLSTFGLWEYQGALYLLYGIVDPKTEVDAGKHRITKVSNPPTEVCNEIGDYSDLM